MLKLQNKWTKVLKLWGTAYCFPNSPSTLTCFLLTEHLCTPLQAHNWPVPHLKGMSHWSKLIMVILIPVPITWLATGM